MNIPPGHKRRGALAQTAIGRIGGLLLVAALVPAEFVQASALFPGARIGAGESPVSPLVADLDADGVADIAVANRDSDDVSVALGRGDGTFGAQTRVPAGPGPVALVAGDFDGDGRPDLAVVGDFGDQVWILPGRGDGTFAAARPVGGPRFPSGLVAADLNGDGLGDLAVASRALLEVTVLLGRGDGTFTTSEPFYPGTVPLALAVADLNRDGRVDLLVGGRFRVAVLAGRGDGSFDSVFVGHAFTNTVSVAVGDVDGDAIPDAVLGGQGDVCDTFFAPGMAVFHGNGDGTLEPTAFLDNAVYPHSIGMADLDGDHKVDLVSGREECFTEGRGTLSFYRGHGDGTFAAPLRSPAGYFVDGLAIGDLDRNGAPDVVVSNRDANSLSALLGQGDGRFSPGPPGPMTAAVGDAPSAIVAGDFDQDGRPDLAVANDASHDVSVMLAAGGGRFVPGQRLPVGFFPQSLLAIDLNGDAHLDLVADDRILFGDGDGGFTNGPALYAGYRPLAVASGDLDGDGRIDLAVADPGDFNFLPGAVALFLNAGGGRFLPAGRLEAGPAPVAVVVADLDGDGRPDLTAADAFGTELWVFGGNGDGTFADPRQVAAGLWSRALLAVDVDGDHNPDLVTGGFNVLHGAGTIAVLRGRGDGTFAEPDLHVCGPSALGLAAADVDADGDTDLVSPSYEADTVSILLNRGDGSFAPQAVFFAGDAPTAVATADLDGDARIDLAVANGLVPGTMTVLLNQGPFPNRGPLAAPLAALTFECTSPAGAVVVLDGRGSTDPDSTPGTADDIASFEWYENFATTTQRLVAVGPVANATLALGVHTITLVVADQAGATDNASVTVSVVDTRAPIVGVRMRPARLWPPNHQMVDVRAAVAADDVCGLVTLVLESVTSSEPDDVAAGDIDGVAPGSPDFDLRLRAERGGSGPGRVYTLVYRATDGAGNSTRATATVIVPRSAAGTAGGSRANPPAERPPKSWPPR